MFSYYASTVGGGAMGLVIREETKRPAVQPAGAAGGATGGGFPPGAKCPEIRQEPAISRCL